MKTKITLLLFTICLAVSAQTDEIFVHVATAANTSGHITYIDHPFLNGNASADIFITNNYNPGGSGGVLNDNQSGTWYDGTQWSIFNEDISAMTVGASFNVYIAKGGSTLEHIADGTSYTEIISDSEINGDSEAVIIAAKYWNPNCIYNTQNYGFWYNDGDDRWNLFTEDLDPQPANAAYKVLVAPGTGGSIALKHTATPANISSNWTALDHPALNGNPDASLIVMHNWGTTGDAANIILDKVIGVWYTGDSWAIYNENQTVMAPNLEFNVYISVPILGTEDVSALEVSLYPNPAVNTINISAREEIKSITLFNILGQQIKVIEVDSLSTIIDISNLQVGQYFAKIESETGTETHKIIKN